MNKSLKILVIRLSSMGDIVYTTPIVRCLKLQLPGSEIHFLTKPAFKYIYDNNPYLDKLHLLQPKLSDTVQAIKAENFDYIIDLHNNLRTTLIKWQVSVKSSTYNKQPLKKWLSLKFKKLLFPPTHLVERYLKTVAFLGVKNDHQPINYYLHQEYHLNNLLPVSHQRGFVAFIIGATHFTKRMPNEKVISICNQIKQPIVLLGGKDVQANGEIITAASPHHIYNACGIISLDESVFIVSQAEKIIGFDTGLTHIAEAFNKPIVSIWGSTIPELLGVQPYEVSDALVVGIDLYCRPCSKFGLEKCPEGHFRCMKEIPADAVVNFINK
ncbi:MAG: glycosyltransferase family 9 protein [Sphingobacteriaceae bacterium]